MLRLSNLRPDRLPLRLRLGAYGVAVAVLLYLTLAPSRDLPTVHLWDKAEHAIAWFVLASIGLVFWPARPRLIAGFAFCLGALVEVLQWAMPLGRDGDVHDLLADTVGIAVALLAWAAVRSMRRRIVSRRPIEA
jgi:VanZ family protein